MATPVNAISELRIRWFCSIPLKYPFCSRLVKTVICKNNALPKLLSPKQCISNRNFGCTIGKVKVMFSLKINVYIKY